MGTADKPNRPKRGVAQLVERWPEEPVEEVRLLSPRQMNEEYQKLLKALEQGHYDPYRNYQTDPLIIEDIGSVLTDEVMLGMVEHFKNSLCKGR